MKRFLLPFLLALPLAAQSPTVSVSGRVVRVDRGDTLIAAGAEVTLHHVSVSAAGQAIDSVRADRNGQYRFLLSPDSGIYLVSARWSGIEYFAPPIPAETMDQPVEVLIAVVDGTTEVTVTLIARQIIVTAPTPDGTREVVDAFTFGVDGTQARVPTKKGTATWRILLPAGALDPRVGDSDFAEDAFERMGDTLALMAGIPPGRHVLLIGYRIPKGLSSFSLPALDRADTLTVMAEEGGLKPVGFVRIRKDTIEGRTFSEWSGEAGAADVILQLPWDGAMPSWFVGTLAALMGLGMTLAVAATLRRNPRHLGTPAADPVSTRAVSSGTTVILDRIAALDQQLNTVDPATAEWNEFLRERTRLKQELQQLLQQGRGAPPSDR